MHRTEGANNVNNLFTDGPPGTCVDDSWLNTVQEEICNAIEAAMDDQGGALVVHPGETDTRDQLLQALRYFQMQAPHMTTAERNAMVARNGMRIYNTTTNQFEGYQAGAWINI